MKNLFSVITLPVVLSLWLFQGSLNQISRDSVFYDGIGRRYARLSVTEPLWWIHDRQLWIDDRWKAFFGVVYSWFGPHLLIPMLINAVLAACAAVILYRLALAVSKNTAVATASSLVFALCPSVVFYTSLPLKEAVAVTALLLTAYGVWFRGNSLFGKLVRRFAPKASPAKHENGGT